MIGLSTSYYAAKGCSIYESVLKIIEMGFDVVEFGAAHAYEENILDILTKIKKDFRQTSFTIHTLFPPLRKRTWFNPADGLNRVNMEIVDNLFNAALIVEALFISIHPAVFYEVTLGDCMQGNFYKPTIGNPKDIKTGRKNFAELMSYMSKKSDNSRTKVIIENMDSSFANRYPSGKDDFGEIFKKISGTGMLLDVEHAMACGNLDELIELDGNIHELHLHDIGYGYDGIKHGHFPIKHKSFFEPLKKMGNLNSIIFVFEHGANVSEKDILKEKELLKEFLVENYGEK
jgi:hypothetical protein